MLRHQLYILLYKNGFTIIISDIAILIKRVTCITNIYYNIITSFFFSSSFPIKIIYSFMNDDQQQSTIIKIEE